MARPANTYRGARRNQWRELNAWPSLSKRPKASWRWFVMTPKANKKNREARRIARAAP